MVTFSARDSHKELDKKLKVRREDKDTAIISDEEFNPNYRKESYVCDVCGTTMEYNDIEKMVWCNV